MKDQRVVNVELLSEALDYLTGENSAPGSWCDGLIARLRAIISGPGVEPVGVFVRKGLDNYPSLEWQKNYVAKEGDKLYLAAPSAPVPEWPVLDKPALVGGGRFHVGVSARLVVEAAQRHYEYEVTPEKEAERIART